VKDLSEGKEWDKPKATTKQDQKKKTKKIPYAVDLSLWGKYDQLIILPYLPCLWHALCCLLV